MITGKKPIILGIDLWGSTYRLRPIFKRNYGLINTLINSQNTYSVGTEFLLNDPADWSENLSFQNALQMVSKLKTVNDTAERGIKLIEDYNSILTTNEEQKQFVLQVVSDYRKIFPDCKKETLKKKIVTKLNCHKKNLNIYS